MTTLLGGILGLCFLGLSRADHEVTVERGPLYRTAGTHTRMWCRVGGYQGSDPPEFRFSVRRPSAPDREMNVVSTGDPGFSYSAFSRRVLSRDIYTERLSRDLTVLHIVRLQEEDTGDYECYTPNTAATYLGTYSARTYLTVIPDTLQTSMPHRTIETLEGSSLTLTCQASMSSSQHTHLSLSWFLSAGEDTEILTLSRDFVLHPGGTFSDRFMAGDVRLDKLSDTSYRLTIGALRHSDQGEIFCRGSEWIQDPSGDWTKITEKDSEKTRVKVAPRGGGDFEVHLGVSATLLTPGDPLEATCSVTDSSGDQVRVAWLVGGTSMAVWEPSGVTTYTAGAESRLALRRRGLTSWVLRNSQVREEDGGSYACEVTDDRSKTRRTSNLTSVEVKPPAFGPPRVSLATDASRLYEGDSAVFRCSVSASSSVSASPSASLGWFHRQEEGGDWTHVISVLQDGRLEVGAGHRSRHDSGLLTAEKTDPGLFRLRMDRVTHGDRGQYVCRYSGGRDVATQSNAIHMDITRLGSGLQVSLMTRSSVYVAGTTASLYCKARAEFSLRGRRVVWSWSFRPDSDDGGYFQSLVRGSGCGELLWGYWYPDFKGKTQLSLSNTTSVLQVHRVQRSGQSGTYRCGVTVLTTDRSAGTTDRSTGTTDHSAGTTDHSAGTTATVHSNVVTIRVQPPDMKLRLDSTDHTLTFPAGQDEAVVTCRILERTPDTSLSLVWFFHSPSSSSPIEILRLDHQGVMTSESPVIRSPFITGRSSLDSYFLRILRPTRSNVGTYHCAVQEWLPEETGDWIQLGERKSGDTQISLINSDQTLKLFKQNVSSSVQQGADLVLHCPLEAGLSPSSLLSVSWYRQGWGFLSPRLLYRWGQDGVTESADARLRLRVPQRGDYSLVLQGAGPEDGGGYFCQMEEWRLQEGRWMMAASDQSGVLNIRVTLPEGHLTLNGTDVTLEVAEHGALSLPCQVMALSSPSSFLSVSWWKAGGPGAPHSLLFGVNHTGEFVYPEKDAPRFQYERPSELTFHLRIQRSHMTDSGTYHCRVQEWLPRPRGAWEPIGEQQSGDIHVTVQTAGLLSPVCTPPPVFHFLLAFTVLFFITLCVITALGLRHLKGRRGGQRGAPGALWSSVKMSEVEKEDDHMTPDTRPGSVCKE